LKNIQEAILFRQINGNGKLIAKCTNPSLFMQLAAVRSFGVISLIKNPCEEVIFEALNFDPCSIKEIESPTDAMYEIAVKNYPHLIRSLDNVSERLKVLAILVWYNSINFCKNSSIELVTISRKRQILSCIKMAVLEYSYSDPLIRYAQNDTDTLIIVAKLSKTLPLIYLPDVTQIFHKDNHKLLPFIPSAN